MTKIKLGITLYSFTKEYVSGEYSFEDCIKRCSEIGVDGYEIVATQMIPSYPYISEEFLGMINKYAGEYGVRPISYGANTDRGMRFDRDLNDDELFVRTVQDIKSAHKLGCRVMRAQYLLSPENLVRIAPYAREYNVKVGIEIHNPETPSSPMMLKYLEAIEKSGSHYIGFVPDFGCFADKPNIESYYGALQRGADEKMLDFAVGLKYDGIPMQDAVKILTDKNADAEVMASLYNMYGFLSFSKNPDFEGLKRILPYCFHFHGKFHAMEDDGNEMSIPYDKILPIIDDSGFDGYIVSEFEGHMSGKAYDMTKKHIEMERRILGLG
ncbi:sugar phosphate isomerase/epimerase family protein [Anaerocolumna jejuensis]|uniref:sugar phosphate isomerase/epimerase family protein n=1 Tax=Anaerocolumna jejuensis TaxID=259063 RepID=UPI003F7C217E